MNRFEEIANHLEKGAAAYFWEDAEHCDDQAVTDLAGQTQMAMKTAARILTESTFIHEVLMQDIVGDYDTPDDVPEWTWIEEHASFKHVHNGVRDGIWEYILNLDLELANPPERLAPIIQAAREMGVSMLLIHQGT